MKGPAEKKKRRSFFSFPESESKGYSEGTAITMPDEVLIGTQTFKTVQPYIIFIYIYDTDY